MKMKYKVVFTLAFVFCYCRQLSAQIRHYVTQNAIVFKDYYNGEKNKSHFPVNFIIPNFSYRAQKEKIALELYINDIIGTSYHMTNKDEVPFTPENVKNGDLVRINSTNIGFCIHYSIIDQKYLQINPLIGVIKNWYKALYVERWTHFNEVFLGTKKESRLGLLTGININIPIWKGIYANTNTRYSVFPGATFNKQNLILDVGLGYTFQNKPQKK